MRSQSKKSFCFGILAFFCGQAVAAVPLTYDQLVTDLGTHLYVTEMTPGVGNTAPQINASVLYSKVKKLSNAFIALASDQRKAYGYGMIFKGSDSKPNAQFQGLIDQIMTPVVGKYPVSFPGSPATEFGISPIARSILLGAVMPGLNAMKPYF